MMIGSRMRYVAPATRRKIDTCTWDNRGVGMLQRMRPRAGVTAISYRKSSSSLLPQTVVRLLNLAWKNCQRNESPTSRPFNLLSVRWLQPGNPAFHCRTKHLAGRITGYGRNNSYRGAGLSLSAIRHGSCFDSCTAKHRASASLLHAQGANRQAEQ